MIVEKVFVLNSKRKIRTIHAMPLPYSNIRRDLIERANNQYAAFGERLANLHFAFLHEQLQNDFAKHKWYMETN